MSKNLGKTWWTSLFQPILTYQVFSELSIFPSGIGPTVPVKIPRICNNKSEYVQTCKRLAQQITLFLTDSAFSKHYSLLFRNTLHPRLDLCVQNFCWYSYKYLYKKPYTGKLWWIALFWMCIFIYQNMPIINSQLC